MKNSILLRRKSKVILTNGTSVLPDVYLATALKNIESLGFTFSQNLIDSARTLSIDEFTSFYKVLVKDLKQMVGAHVLFKPMYPNFPAQVMEASDSELYINAIIHYIGSFVRDVTGHDVTEESLPVYEKEERFPLIEKVDLKVIDLGTEKEFDKMISNLIASKTSISATDKEDVEWAIRTYEDVTAILPEEIVMKENLAFVVSALFNYDKASTEAVSRYFKTATDVLRLAVALSDGDVSLATNTRFRKFKRAERRFLLSLLEKCPSITEDMLRYKTRWIRLGEILHPSEYKTRFKKTHESFDILRNDKEFHTFNGKVETALLEKDILKVTNLLVKRPGEFARRLDHLLRLTSDSDVVLSRFEKIAGEVSTPVLLQISSHFKNRNNEKDLRVIFPKGNVANVTAIENTLPEISSQICSEVVNIVEKTLISRFSELPSLGKVSLDEKLKGYLVPFSQRSASKALRTIVRGSQVDMPEGDTIRFFLWWKEGKVNGVPTGRVDIDLSAIMYDENWNYMEHISYTNLRSAKYKAAHSGDITSAPNGACEFIDIDIPSVVSYGGRYVVANLYSFTHHPYCDLPECFAGWMMRKEPKSGEVFEPSTVQDKLDLSANTQICIPVILDLKERKVIWTDLSLTRDLYYANNVENNKGTVTLMGKAMTSLVKPSLYDLFELHAKARGQLDFELDEGEEPDTVFSLDKGITPFDIETIMADFIA